MRVTYKICTKCGKELEATTEFFNKLGGSRFGLKAECKVCANKRCQEWKKNNKEKHAAVQKKWRKDNAEHIKKCRAENVEYYKKYKKKWKIKNRDKVCAYTAKRRAIERDQLPDLTQNEKHQIELIYKKSRELGPNWQVDHIIPSSKGGLYHPDNLQIVLKSYNLEKHAKLNFRKPFEWEIHRI